MPLNVQKSQMPRRAAQRRDPGMGLLPGLPAASQVVIQALARAERPPAEAPDDAIDVPTGVPRTDYDALRIDTSKRKAPVAKTSKLLDWAQAGGGAAQAIGGILGGDAGDVLSAAGGGVAGGAARASAAERARFEADYAAYMDWLQGAERHNRQLDRDQLRDDSQADRLEYAQANQNARHNDVQRRARANDEYSRTQDARRAAENNAKLAIEGGAFAEAVPALMDAYGIDQEEAIGIATGYAEALQRGVAKDADARSRAWRQITQGDERIQISRGQLNNSIRAQSHREQEDRRDREEGRAGSRREAKPTRTRAQIERDLRDVEEDLGSARRPEDVRALRKVRRELETELVNAGRNREEGGDPGDMVAIDPRAAPRPTSLRESSGSPTSARPRAIANEPGLTQSEQHYLNRLHQTAPASEYSAEYSRLNAPVGDAEYAEVEAAILDALARDPNMQALAGEVLNDEERRALGL